MNALVRTIAGVVRSAPLVVLTVVVVLTGVLGFFSGQAEQVTGNEGFSPDNEELQALETAGELFGGTTSVMQVVVDGGDAVSPEAVTAVAAVREALTETVGDRLEDDPSRGGAVLSYLLPIEQIAAQGGPPLSQLDEQALEQAYVQGFQALPDDVRGTIGALLPADAEPAEARASKGLVLAFVDLEGVSPDEQLEIFESAAVGIRAADLPEGFEARPFAIELLFGDDSFVDEVARLFSIAVAVILVILAFVYFVRPRSQVRAARVIRRSAADVALTLVGIFVAITWMQGIGVLLGPEYAGVIGDFNPVTQIVPILLVGLGVDYAIHLTSRYREEVGHGASVDGAMSGSISTVGVALTLATITSVVGFLTNFTNPVPALRDFGILAAVGIFVAYVVLMTALPATRTLLDRRAERGGRLPREVLSGTGEQALGKVAGSTAVLAERLPQVTLGITLVLAVAGAYGLTQLESRFSFTDFVSEDNPTVVAFDELQSDFGGGFGEQTDVVLLGDVADAEVHNATAAALDDLAEIDDVRMAGDAAAVDHPIPVLSRLVGEIQAATGGEAASGAAPGAAPGAGPDTDAPDGGAGAAQARSPIDPAAVPQLLGAVAATGFDPQTGEVDPSADVAALYDAALAAAPTLFESTLSRLDDGSHAARAIVQTTAGDARPGPLADDLEAAFAAVEEAGVEAVPTSQNIIGAVVADEISEAQLQSLAITVAAAMLLLVVVFGIRERRPFLGVLTVVPVGLVLLWTFGLMALLGIPFSPVTATISALAIGIGVPFTIHVANRFQEDRTRFASIDEAIRSTVTNTGAALVGSAFTTAGGFGVLAFSTLPPFRQLGIVVAIAIVSSLLASILVLPSMLALWDGWHRRRGRAPVTAAPPSEPVGVA